MDNYGKVVTKLNYVVLRGIDKVLGSDDYTAALLMDESVEFYEAIEDDSIYGVYYKNEARKVLDDRDNIQRTGLWLNYYSIELLVDASALDMAGRVNMSVSCYYRVVSNTYNLCIMTLNNYCRGCSDGILDNVKVTYLYNTASGFCGMENQTSTIKVDCSKFKYLCKYLKKKPTKLKELEITVDTLLISAFERNVDLAVLMGLSDSGVTITISTATDGYVGEIRETLIGCALLLAIGNIRVTNLRGDIEYTAIGYTTNNLVDATYYSCVKVSNTAFEKVKEIVMSEIPEIMTYVENYYMEICGKLPNKISCSQKGPRVSDRSVGHQEAHTGVQIHFGG